MDDETMMKSSFFAQPSSTTAQTRLGCYFIARRTTVQFPVWEGLAVFASSLYVGFVRVLRFPPWLKTCILGILSVHSVLSMKCTDEDLGLSLGAARQLLTAPRERIGQMQRTNVTVHHVHVTSKVFSVKNQIKCKIISIASLVVDLRCWSTERNVWYSKISRKSIQNNLKQNIDLDVWPLTNETKLN